MITDHPFRNRCGSKCEPCSHEKDNDCSHTNEDFRLCGKLRSEHATVEEWSVYKPRETGA